MLGPALPVLVERATFWLAVRRHDSLLGVSGANCATAPTYVALFKIPSHG